MADTLKLYPDGAVGFIDWLDAVASRSDVAMKKITPGP